MKRAPLPLAIAVICVLVALFYLIPGPSHPFTTDDPTGSHIKHALLFFGLAVLSVIWARFAANARRGAPDKPAG
jgi:Na+-driven multidrug efflux pump